MWQRWREYLRQDPTRWLLDAEADPSVYLWYLLDIAHRPEDSVAAVEARERVLYSAPVQEIFAAQHAEGYWEPAGALAAPRYRATLWNLALLAELGIPRDSRRARAGCEFALQNFLDAAGRFAGLDTVQAGYLVHALAYFNLASDERVGRAARGLIGPALEADSDEARVAALWAWADFRQEAEISAAAAVARERLLDSLAARGDWAPSTFPPFDPLDILFILRVLAAYDAAADRRAAQWVERLVQEQNERGQWPLARSLNGRLVTRVEEASPASRWATLNAVRVIVNLVVHHNETAG